VTSIMLTPGSLLPTPGTSPVATPVSGLTTGAKAGIGVGAAVGGAVIFGLIFWLAWVLRKRRKDTAKLSPGVDTGEPEWKDHTHGTHESSQGAGNGLGEPLRMTGR
jgi:hypothetical protein